MKRLWLSAGLILFLLPVLFAGCGVAQEEYDAVLADIDNVRQQLQSVNEELAAAQADVSDLKESLKAKQNELDTKLAELSALTSGLETAESDLQTAQSEIGTVRDELEALETEYQDFASEVNQRWGTLDAYLELNNYVLGINAGILRDNMTGVEKGCSLLEGKLGEMNDPELDTLWQDAYIREGGSWTLYHNPFEVFMGKLALRIRSEAMQLREFLAE